MTKTNTVMQMTKIRYLKLRKSELKGNIESLLRRAALVNEQEKHARPDFIFVSKEDARIMQRNCDPWTWFNIGPSTVLKHVVRPGYALIIEDLHVPSIAKV